MHIPIRTKEPAAGPATDQQGAVDHREPRVRKPSHRNVQASPVAVFLRFALAGGAVPVSELEERARTLAPPACLANTSKSGMRRNSGPPRKGSASRRGGTGLVVVAADGETRSASPSAPRGSIVPAFEAGQDGM